MIAVHWISFENVRVRFCVKKLSWVYCSVALTNLGSMLWLQLQTIFANFRRTICVLLKNQCYDPKFRKKRAVFCTKKHHFFANFFGRKYFLNYNIGL
jgi:hypothetical protein